MAKSKKVKLADVGDYQHSARQEPLHPLSAHHDTAPLPELRGSPANENRQPVFRPRVDFWGSEYFWAALGASVLGLGAFAYTIGFSGSASGSSLFKSLASNSNLLLALVGVVFAVWWIALSAHRQRVEYQMWRGVITATNRLFRPDMSAERSVMNIRSMLNDSLDQISEKILEVEDRGVKLQAAFSMTLSETERISESNLLRMQGLIAEAEKQKSQLQDIGMMISTEAAPVLSKLEFVITSLGDLLSQSTTQLPTMSHELGNNVMQLKHAISEINQASQLIGPDLERNVGKIDRLFGNLPKELDYFVKQLVSQCEILSSAALLSTENVERIARTGDDLGAKVDVARQSLEHAIRSGHQMMEKSLDHASAEFRAKLQAAIADETNAVKTLLADSASIFATPLVEIKDNADQALDELDVTLERFQDAINTRITQSVAQFAQSASATAKNIASEMQKNSLGIQNDMVSAAGGLTKRFETQATKLESIMVSSADKMMDRIDRALKETPTNVARRFETQIAKIEGAIRSSTEGLSANITRLIEDTPVKLDDVANGVIEALESRLVDSSGTLSDSAHTLTQSIRRQATEITEELISEYVEFIELAIVKLRNEMGSISSEFTSDFERILQRLESRRNAGESSGRELSSNVITVPTAVSNIKQLK